MLNALCSVPHRLPYSAINFWAYERLTESWNAALPPVQGSHGMDVARRLTAGGVAGMAACAVVRPCHPLTQIFCGWPHFVWDIIFTMSGLAWSLTCL